MLNYDTPHIYIWCLLFTQTNNWEQNDQLWQTVKDRRCVRVLFTAPFFWS